MSLGEDTDWAIILTYRDRSVKLTTPIFVDWDDDDEHQVRITFYAENVYE